MERNDADVTDERHDFEQMCDESAFKPSDTASDAAERLVKQGDPKRLIFNGTSLQAAEKMDSGRACNKTDGLSTIRCSYSGDTDDELDDESSVAESNGDVAAEQNGKAGPAPPGLDHGSSWQSTNTSTNDEDVKQTLTSAFASISKHLLIDSNRHYKSWSSVDDKQSGPTTDDKISPDSDMKATVKTDSGRKIAPADGGVAANGHLSGDVDSDENSTRIAMESMLDDENSSCGCDASQLTDSNGAKSYDPQSLAADESNPMSLLAAEYVNTDDSNPFGEYVVNHTTTDEEQEGGSSGGMAAAGGRRSERRDSSSGDRSTNERSQGRRLQRKRLFSYLRPQLTSSSSDNDSDDMMETDASWTSSSNSSKSNISTKMSRLDADGVRAGASPEMSSVDTWTPMQEVFRRELGLRGGRSTSTTPFAFQRRARSSVDLVRRFERYAHYEEHSGCVNALHFNESGNCRVLIP